MNEETEKVFYPRPMLSFRTFCKISCCMVRANLYLLDRVAGSNKCNKKRCKVWVNVF